MNSLLIKLQQELAQAADPATDAERARHRVELLNELLVTEMDLAVSGADPLAFAQWLVERGTQEPSRVRIRSNRREEYTTTTGGVVVDVFEANRLVSTRRWTRRTLAA